LTALNPATVDFGVDIGDGEFRRWLGD